MFVIAAIGRPAKDRGMTDRSVLVVLFDGVQSLDVTGPVEVFTGAGKVTGGRGGYPHPHRLARTARPYAPPAG